MSKTLESFVLAAKQFKSPIVLELGTYRSIPTRSTLHKNFVPHFGKWIGTDIVLGEDVQLVADLHRLTKFILPQSVDIIISCSTFEHLKYPFIAAHEIAKTIRIGGLIFIQTHHCFPLHAYPYDYFRFSTEALSGLFGTKNGIEVISCDYEFSAEIVSDRFDRKRTDWLNSVLFACKISETPEEFQYEWDNNLEPLEIKNPQEL